MRNIWRVVTVAAAVICLFSSTSWAVTWSEVGDAGNLPSTAQPTGPVPGVLTSISGTISSSTDADMFAIFITNPAAFSATTVGTPGTLGDTQLFLFDESGHGVYANDDNPSGGTLRSRLPAGDPNSPTGEGLYYIAISSFDRDPVSPGGLIFPSFPFTDVFGPTGPGGGSAISGWTGSGGTGTYTIALTGANAVPAPASLALIGLGLVGILARRRSRRTASA